MCWCPTNDFIFGYLAKFGSLRKTTAGTSRTSEICVYNEKKKQQNNEFCTCGFPSRQIYLTSPRKQGCEMIKFEVLWRTLARNPPFGGR